MLDKVVKVCYTVGQGCFIPADSYGLGGIAASFLVPKHRRCNVSEQTIEKLRQARELRDELVEALAICDSLITGLEQTLGTAVLAEIVDRQNPEHFYQTNTTLNGFV